MKDSKSILLLIVSVLLILVSCALLWTWGFNFNNFPKEKPVARNMVRDSKSSENTRDSLQKIYNATIRNMSAFDSAWLQADSLKDSLDLNLGEFYKLRNEINLILQNPNNKEDLEIARQKIGELQKRVDQLRDKNMDIEKENNRLSAVLQQLTKPGKQIVQNVQPVVYTNREPGEADHTATNFTANELRLSAMMVDEGKEQETIQALQTDKIVGSFAVKNSNAEYNKAEIFVVILLPDGKTLQNSTWETGRFDTREGKKIYSSKFNFEYKKGETKRLSFSLNTDRSLKGNYTMQVYHNGEMIGKIIKSLI